MIQKGERPTLVHGGQPDGELGDLDCQRVLIHAVNAAVRHQTAGENQALFVGGGNDQLARFAAGGLAFRGYPKTRITALRIQDIPGFYQPLREVTDHLHQKAGRTHGHVADLQFQQFGGAFQLPFFFGQPLSWTGVNQRFQGMQHDRFGQAARCVMRAGGAARGAGGHIHAAGQEDCRVAKVILAQQAGIRRHPLQHLCIVVAGDEQVLVGEHVRSFLQGFAQRVF